MSDTIDRQAAIDAAAFGITYAKKINKETGEVEALFEQSNEELRKAIDRINALPSAEPTEEQVTDYCHRRCLVVVTSDLYSEMQRRWSAEPQRKKGKWIVEGEFIDCSVCRRGKWSRIPYEDLVKRFRFCPNCGADMRGGGDG